MMADVILITGASGFMMTQSSNSPRGENGRKPPISYS